MALKLLGGYFFDVQSAASYTLINLKALEQLGKTDIVVLEETHYGGKLEFLSVLSQFHNIKILSERSRH